MHPNPAYRQASADQNLALARDRGFGILAVNGPDGPLAAHVPFVLSPEDGYLELHLVRSNPVARALETPRPALLAVSGPDAYISPDWYATEHQVPTWNYVAVHLRGTLRLCPHDEMREHLDRLSAEFENRLFHKTPWLTAKLPGETLDRMMRQIVPARMDITSIDGTWKLNQNKTEAARLSAAGHVARSTVGARPEAVADMMRHPPS